MMWTDTTSMTAETGQTRRRRAPPDHWPVDRLRWALFTASFTRIAPNWALRHVLARNAEAMRAAGISAPELIGPRHDVESFDCGDQHLNDSLKRSAGAAEPGRPKPQTFVAAAGHRIAAFYTTRLGSVSAADGAKSDTVPVSILRHFAVDRRWKDGRIAADLAWHILHNLYAGASATETRGLVGYAISRRVKRLYMYLGGRPMPDLVYPLAVLVNYAEIAEALRNPGEHQRAENPASDDANTVVVRSNDVADVEADGRLVAFNIYKGKCFELNGVAARIWALVNRPVRVAELCQQLMREYDVDRQTCESQVLELLAELHSKGLVETLPQGPHHGA